MNEPVELTRENVIEWIVQLGEVFDEADAAPRERWLRIPPKTYYIILFRRSMRAMTRTRGHWPVERRPFRREFKRSPRRFHRRVRGPFIEHDVFEEDEE